MRLPRYPLTPRVLSQRSDWQTGEVSARSTPAEIAVQLDRAAEVALPVQLAAALREAIDAGTLRPAESLPATRVFAARIGVARGVVVAAYEQLVAEGYLTAEQGRGTVVNPDLVGRWGEALRVEARRGSARPGDTAPGDTAPSEAQMGARVCSPPICGLRSLPEPRSPTPRSGPPGALRGAMLSREQGSRRPCSETRNCVERSRSICASCVAPRDLRAMCS